MAINAIASVSIPQAENYSPQVRDLHLASSLVDTRLTAPEPVGNDPGVT